MRSLFFEGNQQCTDHDNHGPDQLPQGKRLTEDNEVDTQDSYWLQYRQNGSLVGRDVFHTGKQKQNRKYGAKNGKEAGGE